MAKNPMQRKAQNSFLIGILITLLITGTIIVFLILQIKGYKEREQEELKSLVNVAVFKQNVKSGQIVTENMLERKKVNKNTVPTNAIGEIANLSEYSLSDTSGRQIVRLKDKIEKDNNTNKNGNSNDNNIESREESKEETYSLYRIFADHTKQKLILDEETDKYYVINKLQNGSEQKEYIEFANVPMVAKIDIDKNTVAVSSAIARADKLVGNDLRTQEFNMFVLQSQIQTGDTIDVRLRLPNGNDYIVLSHKEITIPQIGDVDSADTISLNISEAETLTLSCAIVENYKINGSMLYITKYIEPGLQSAAIPTYIPDADTMNLIARDPNCVEEAKKEIYSRYANNELNSTVRNPINNGLSQNAEDALDNVISKTQQEIEKNKEERKNYLDSLND